MRRNIFNIICISLCTTLYSASASAQASAATTRIDRNISIFNDVFRQLDISYSDTLNYDELTETALNALLHKVDPYTVYVPESKDDDLKRLTTGKYGGIGALIMQRQDKDYITISDPYESLPAQRNDVRAGDMILEVDGTDCKGKTTAEVSALLRGKAGTTVKLKLQRPEQKKPVIKEFTREEIKLPTVDYSALVSPTTGYISFSEFTEDASQEFRHALEQLVAEGCQELIIDLRGNGGGLISEAISIVSLFVPKGTEVVSTKGKLPNASRVYKTTTQPLYPDMPLYVLVDEHSASASEITCGALQDLHRATLYGCKTFGKGLVQNIRNVSYGGHLKVTTARYYLPSGRCIQGTGIEPDIEVNDSSKVNICYELYRKNLFFDYATQYTLSHNSYSKPSTFIKTQAVDSALLRDFEVYLNDKEFTYETETSKYFADILRLASQEDLDSTMVAELKSVQEKLKTGFHDALWKHADEVQNFLQQEIASRYYYQKGRTAIKLQRDPYLLRVLNKDTVPERR
ncbi:MAG: S41 family peptidase [Paludibacteraceae bacterium]|nr:S41 family peptidase [Paludibacteraceae bacterium]